MRGQWHSLPSTREDVSNILGWNLEGGRSSTVRVREGGETDMEKIGAGGGSGTHGRPLE